MKQTHRLLSLLLALALLCSLLPTAAFAVEVEPEEAAAQVQEDNAAAPEEETTETPEEEIEEVLAEVPAEEEIADETVAEAPMQEGEPTSYGLWVGNVKVTSANQDEIREDESSPVLGSYDPDTYTLTLTDAVIPTTNGTYRGLIDFVCYDDDVTLTVTGSAVLGGEGCGSIGIWVTGCNLAVNGTGDGIRYTGSRYGIYSFRSRSQSNHPRTGGSLTLLGTISVSSSSLDAILSDGEMTVKDGANLTATTASTSFAGLHSRYGPLSIEGGTVYAEGGNGIEVYYEREDTDRITISGGNVTAISKGDSQIVDKKGCGIYAWNGITLSGGTITARSESTGASYGLNAYTGGIDVQNGVTKVTAQAGLAILAYIDPLTIGNQLP